MLIIDSPQNSRIREWAKLHKASERRSKGLFLVEGVRELQRALKAGWQLNALLFSDDALLHNFCDLKQYELVRCSQAAISRVVYREGPEACVGVIQQRPLLLDGLTPRGTSRELWVVVEGAEKPGNIGALLRSIEAVGGSGMILCDPEADIFNPNTVRASTGALFATPIAIASNQDVYKWLRNRGCQIMAATPEGAVRYDQANFNQPLAIILGAESKGLSAFWKMEADCAIALPMQGSVDSLNLSTTAAVILYEALRQRTPHTI